DGTATVVVDLEAHDQGIYTFSFPISSRTLPSSNISVTYRLHHPGRVVRNHSNAPRCCVFALIVGIDKYASSTIPNLRGCVNDAQTMRAFLTNRFNIPEKTSGATRDAILRTFRTHLIENPDIENGDTMIIYYAGHGSRVKAPDSWPSTDDKIETFVPHDERWKDVQGELVHGIPDRTIGLLLSQLATAKGNNIVCIYLLYRSAKITQLGSLTRVSDPPNILPILRYVDTPTPIPEHLDQELWASSRMPGTVPSPLDTSYELMDSHTLLAACRYQQRARECISTITGSPCGALRGIGPLNRVTYAELLDMLPTLPDQDPQCEGANKRRFIFQGGMCEPAESLSCAVRVKEDGTLKVDVGSMFGVVVGTQFVSEKDPQTDPDRVFVAVSVDLNSAILMARVPQVLPTGTRLVVAHWKNEAAMMKVYIQPDEDLPLSASDLLVPRTTPRFLVVDSRDTADLVIKRTSKEEITLTRLDAHLARYDTPDVLLNVSAIAHIPYVLDSIGRFNYFLAKHNTQDVLDLGRDVQLEMHRLTGEFGFRVPDTEFGNMVVDGEVRFQLDPEAKYGFAICNYSKYDLFPYLFYFDPATYSIDAWYLPESKTMAAPLPARGDSDVPPAQITIGYGTGSVYAFQFVVPDGINKD
ncbi:hypothetical protein FB45DRAFT_951689, partial [Roridomyces roridus]